MARKPKLDEGFSEINIMLLMNIIMLLIPFLIMSTEFIKIGVIEVAAPKIGGPSSQSNSQDKPKKKPLNLTIQISSKGFTLLTQGLKLPQGCNLADTKTPGEKKFPTIKKLENNKHDYKALHECLVKIKKAFDEERRVILMGDPDTKYEVVVGVMDASREIPGKTKKDNKELFPEVIISAGVV